MLLLSGTFVFSFFLTFILSRLPVPAPVSEKSESARRYAGYAPALVFLLSSLFFFWRAPLLCTQILCGGFLFAALGVVEDRFYVSPRLSAVLKLLISFLTFLCGLRVQSADVFLKSYTLPFWASAAFSVFFIFSTVSSVDSLDGSTALAPFVCTAVALLLILTFRLEKSTYVFASCAIFGSLVAVCLLSIPDSYVFLGKGGKYFLGVALSALSVGAFDGNLSFGVFLLFFLFSLDFAFSLAARVLFHKKENVGICLYLRRLGFSELGAVVFLSLFALTVGCIAFFGLF